MTNNKIKKYFLVGSTSLLLKCAEYLLEERCNVVGICSTEDNIRNFCQKNNIPYIKSTSEITNYDYNILLSIVNFEYLQENIIKKAKLYALNYHDSLLPKYAGINASTWAIFNGEKTHGVTWHALAEEIDSGDILAQEEITIDNNETSYSLNIKCQNIGFNLFKNIIINIKNKKELKFTKQDLTKRTYFHQNKKFPNYGIINIEKFGSNIERMYRASFFGPGYRNTVGLCKLVVEDKLYIIKSLFLVKNK